jgi:hypothetical protein
LTLDEIRTWMRRIRYDPEFRRRDNYVPILRLCDWSGVPRSSLYRLLQGEIGLTRNHRARLTVAIRAVEAGLRWRRGQDNNFLIIDPERWHRLPRYERPRRTA